MSVSVAIVVQAPPPAGRRWNSAEATPEPASAESEETVTVAAEAAPSAGAVSEPVGFVLSTTTSWTAESSVLPALSVTRTRTRTSPSAGWLAQVTL